MKIDSMRKNRVKLLLWFLLLITGFMAAWGTIRGLARLIAYFQQGADPAAALNIVPHIPPDFEVALSWLPDDPDTGRQMEPLTREQIEAAYLRAWLQWHLSYLHGEPYGLETYFVGPALTAVESAVIEAGQNGWSIEQVDLTHALQLHFYAADGSIVSFTDTDMRAARLITDGQGNVLYAGETSAAYDVVMFLEDGNWRVRHWVRRENQTGQAGDSHDDSRSCAQCVTTAGTQLILNGEVYQVAGVNYYPQQSPWHQFWPQYDPAVIKRDFQFIRELGLNTIRIFIPYLAFGGADVDAVYLAHLEDLLAQADDHRLKVIVTLFDFRADYGLLQWPGADRHLEALLTHFADNPAILAWDIKNEPDLDYEAHGAARIHAWLVHTAEMIRKHDPNHLITIGWSSPTAAQSLADEVDFISFHYYAPADQLPDHFRQLRQSAGAKPILLSEFGLPTWNSFLFPNGHSEQEQAFYYARILAHWRLTDSPGYLAWTLHDFNEAPASVAGPFPWQTGPQEHMGLVRVDGSLKPAADYLPPGANLEAATWPWYARFLKPFWLTVIWVVVLLASVIVRVRRRRSGTQSIS